MSVELRNVELRKLLGEVVRLKVKEEEKNRRLELELRLQKEKYQRLAARMKKFELGVEIRDRTYKRLNERLPKDMQAPEMPSSSWWKGAKTEDFLLV